MKVKDSAVPKRTQFSSRSLSMLPESETTFIWSRTLCLRDEEDGVEIGTLTVRPYSPAEGPAPAGREQVIDISLSNWARTIVNSP